MGLLDTLLSSTVGVVQQQTQNAFNAREAEKNRVFNAEQAQLAFQRELSADSTKYQRATADMLAAGLNPMLAAGSGGGSVNSSPASGSAASAASVGNLGELFLQGEQLELQKRVAEADIALKESQADKNKVEAEKTGLETSLFRDTYDIRRVLLGDEHERNLWEKEIGLRGVDVKERSQDMLEEQAKHYNDYLDRQAEMISELKVSEYLKREMYRANAREANANATYRAAMQAADTELRGAQSEEARKQAFLLQTEARIKNQVYTPEYIHALCKEAQAEAEYKSIMTAYSKGDYSAASKDLQKVFKNLEDKGVNTWAFTPDYVNATSNAAKALPAL